MNLVTLRSKARRNTLEVEHILAAVRVPAPGLSDGLRALARQYGWSTSAHLPDGTRVVPLGRWVEVAVAYPDGGTQALAPLAARADFTSPYLAFSAQAT